MKNHVSRLAKIVYANNEKNFWDNPKCRGYFLSTRKNSEFWILERVNESRRSEKKVEEFYLHRVSYNRFSMPAASSHRGPSLFHMRGTNNFASRYKDRNLCPSGKSENDHQNLYTSKRTRLWWVTTEISSSRLDWYRIRIWCETIAHVNRNTRFNGLISFCF